jgi:isoleucyl-tRNA synthetase
MTRLMAPVLSFTAEEVWSYITRMPGDEESVHMALFPAIDHVYLNEASEAKWDRLIQIRGEVAKALEIARKDRLIGHSLEAHVAIVAGDELFTFLKGVEEDLPSFFIVSSVGLQQGVPPQDVFLSREIEGLGVVISRAKGGKCERCWNYSEFVGTDAEHPTICKRCLDVLQST